MYVTYQFSAESVDISNENINEATKNNVKR